MEHIDGLAVMVIIIFLTDGMPQNMYIYAREPNCIVHVTRYRYLLSPDLMYSFHL